MREIKNLDFFLVESVDKDLNVWGDTVLAVFLDGTLGIGLEDGGTVGVVGLEVLQGFLHELLDVNCECFLIKESLLESMSEDNVTTGDGFFFSLLHATFGRGITTEESIVELAGNIGNALALDFKDHFVNDLGL